MAWTYDATNLTNTTASGRLYSVRLLVGDTNSGDPQLQDEEITFSLGQNGDNIYNAAAFCCRLLASKYSRLVDTQLDGALQASYSDRMKHYNLLYTQISDLAKKVSGKALGVSAGGISVAAVEVVNADTDRVQPEFEVDQFDNPGAGKQYIPDYN